MPERGSAYHLSTVPMGPMEADLANKGTQEGHLRKRRNTWHVFYQDWLTDADGRSYYGPTSTSTRCSSYKEAKKRAAEIVAKANASAECPRGTATLSQFVDSQYRPKLIAKEKATREITNWAIDRFIIPAFGAMRLNDITHADVQRLISGIRAAKKSWSTAYQVQSALSRIFRHARKLGAFTGERPTVDVELGHNDKQEALSLTWPQVVMLNDKMPAKHRDILPTMALTGMRPGEAMGLRWRSVNLSDEWKPLDGWTLKPYTILITDQFTHGEWKRLPKNKKPREYPLTTYLWVLLQERYERLEWNGPDHAVFAALRGKPMAAGNFTKRVLKPAGKLVGIPEVHLHAFRHTAASLMDQQGMTMAEKQRLLGHASAAMTQHYTHAQIGEVRTKLEGMVN